MHSIEEAISSAALFVLFISPNSKSKEFVEFETALARLTRPRQPRVRFISVPIKGATHKDLPEWLNRYFAVPAQYTASDIERLINYEYNEFLVEAHMINRPLFEGREELRNKIYLDVLQDASTSGIAINTLLFSGLPGSGRRSIASAAIAEVYSASRPAYPVFSLPDSGGAIDLHLALSQDIRGELSPDQIEAEVRGFPKTPKDQAKRITATLLHWSEINQPVVILNRWGFFDRSGFMADWFSALVEELRSHPNCNVIFIAGRRPRAEQLIAHKNLKHFAVGDLSENAIARILTKSVRSAVEQPALIRKIASLINGHPGTALHTVFLVNEGKSLELLLKRPEHVYSFQDKILEDIFDTLSPLEKRLLLIMSWVPSISIDLATSIFPVHQENELLSSFDNLLEHNLLTLSETVYRLPEIVRSTIRRRKDSYDESALRALSQQLTTRFEAGRVDVNLVDTLLFLTGLSGAGLPDELKQIITPSALSTSIERQYELGSHSGTNEEVQRYFLLCQKLARLALGMEFDDDALERALMLGGKAAARSGGDVGFFISALEQKGFPAAYFLKGSNAFYQERDYPLAIKSLEQLLGTKHFRRETVRLLARIYLQVGKPLKTLEALDTLKPGEVERDSGLLVLKIRALYAVGKREQAKLLENDLEPLDDESGFGLLLKAGRAHREKRDAEALEYIAAGLKLPESDKFSFRVLKVSIDIATNKDTTDLPGVCDLAEVRRRPDVAYSLKAQAALRVQNDWRTALTYVDKIKAKNWFDYSLEVSILEVALKDPIISADSVRRGELETRRNKALLDSRTADLLD
jgi:tetratricopeptide (TPR) repeat protein